MKNKNWLISLIVGIIVLTVIVTVVIIVRNTSNDSGKKISSKIEDELKYLDRTTLAMINQLNNLKTSDEIEVNRTSIGKTAQNIVSDSSNGASKEGSDQSGQGGGDSSSSSSDSSDSSGGDSKAQNIEKFYVENNSILLRDTSSVDWNSLQSQAENLYNSWTTITLDLNTMNVSNDNILAYNSNLDNLLISVKDKNKANSAICLANLYSLIPKYMSETLQDETNLKIENIKSNIISAYSLVEIDRWDDIKKLLGNAESDLTTFINSSTNLSTAKRAKINKAYVLLKELIKTSNDKNKDMFYFKYINLIDELDNV